MVEAAIQEQTLLRTGWEYGRFYSISPAIIQFIVRVTSKILFRTFFRYEVRGRENVDRLSGGAIFASNHTSELDPIIIPSSLRISTHLVPFFYVSREKEFYNSSGWRKSWYGGRFFRMLGAYQVYAGQMNYASSLRNHIKVLNDGHSVCIFPEGKKTKDGNIGEARGGVAYLAYATGKPVIPVSIDGLFALTLKDVLLRRRRLIIAFGKPLYPSDLFIKSGDSAAPSVEEFKTVAAKIMNIISRMFLYNRERR